MKFLNREAFQLETETLRVTVLKEGGHIAEILHKKADVNPLWIPPWPSIEPSQYDELRHPEYGRDVDSKLICGIMGQSLCLDTFGPPPMKTSATESAFMVRDPLLLMMAPYRTGSFVFIQS